MNTLQKNVQVQKMVALVSIILFFIKMAAWYITSSVAILTDALESVVNMVAGLIGLYSLIISAKPRDIDHPYGHGKVEFISAAVEGTLITVAGCFIIYEAVLNLWHPHQISQLDWGILLIAITGLVNFFLGRYCLQTGKRNNSLALMASGKHLQSDTWSTVGLIAGLAILYATSIWWIDSIIAMLFALIIIYTGYTIVRSSVAGIMDKADDALLQKLIDTLNRNRRINWIDLHNLRIIKYGSILHLDCHLTVPWYFNVNEAHDEVDALSTLVRQNFGSAVELFVHSDGCLETSCAICSKADCPVRLHDFQKRVEWSMENIIANHKHTIDS